MKQLGIRSCRAMPGIQTHPWFMSIVRTDPFLFSLKIVANRLIDKGPLLAGMPRLKVELTMESQCTATRHMNAPCK
jgi:hypothetical protein